MNQSFATEWIDAWNSHDLALIMDHYHENIQFNSPFIQQMGVNANGQISNKKSLKEYFALAFDKYPQLRFQLHHEFIGVQSTVLVYTSVNNLLAAEYMEFDKEGKVIKVTAHYVK